MKSILQDRRECWAWRHQCDLEVTQGLEVHHIFFGQKRKMSDANGFVVYLTKANHTGNNPNDNPLGIRGVHFNKEMDSELKRCCQEKYEQTHTRAAWMALVGRNYLED